MCGLSDSGDNNNLSLTTRTERQVRYQSEDLSKQFLEVVSATQETIDFCVDGRGLSFLLSNEQLWKVIIGLINRDIRSRFITKITNESISYCNVLMKYSGELFHEDRVKGNFLIVDGRKYIFFVVEIEKEVGGQRQKQIIQQVLYNEVKPFVDTQQYLFDNLCSNAIPARDKIREIGKAVRGDFIDTLRSPSEIQKTAINLLESATYEILVLFSTTNSFYRAEHSGILNSLWQASERGVMVKMLIQTDDHNQQLRETLQKKIKQKRLPINIQYITKLLQNKITTLVIDQAVSLAIEANDDNNYSKKTSDQNMTTAAVAVHSNNESTVSSCLSIFETLWIQSEFDKQKKAKQAYFQMFKGFNLKDEIYARNWSFSEKTPHKGQGEGRQNTSKADSRT
jgi:hypothetical protein